MNTLVFLSAAGTALYAAICLFRGEKPALPPREFTGEAHTLSWGGRFHVIGDYSSTLEVHRLIRADAKRGCRAEKQVATAAPEEA
jgi:hypothetical protein